MSWDGIYRPKAHMRVRTKHVNPRTGAETETSAALCGRGHVKSYASTEMRVNCFACLKAMGVIK